MILEIEDAYRQRVGVLQVGSGLEALGLGAGGQQRRAEERARAHGRSRFLRRVAVLRAPARLHRLRRAIGPMGLASPTELLTSPSELLASPTELLTSPSELLASPSELVASPSELLASPSEL